VIRAGVRTDSMIGVTEFGAFSVGISQVQETVHYIEQQLEHHRTRTRLLQAALWQAERLAEMAPESEALQTAQVTRLTTYQLVSPFSERFLRSPVVNVSLNFLNATL
jgi:hypothetical protein